jgi:membrane-bound lytic murein transglycosylase D
VEDLAQRYGMTIERLRSVNGLAGNAIAPGQPLVLAALNPAATSATPSASTLTISADTDTTPDTLASPAPVARLAAATPVTLAASAAQEGANTPARAAASGTRPPVAVVGDSAERADAPRRVLTTLAAQTASSPDSNVSRHTVAAGDTLYNIARRYNLSVAELKTLTRLDDEAIKLGQTLTVKGNASSAVASAKPASKPEPRETRKEYVVQKGDTLFSIARKFNIDHDDLKKWNQTKALARLQPGFKLTLWTGGR